MEPIAPWPDPPRRTRMRKPIQVSGYDKYGKFMVLCDDGTIWERVFNEPERKWLRLPPIPQGQE